MYIKCKQRKSCNEGLVLKSLRVFPSSRSRIIADQEVEAKAVCSGTGSRSSIHIDKVVVGVGRASEEATTVVGQVVKFALLRDGKSSLGRTLANSGVVRLSKSQGTNVADIDLLTPRNFDLEVEGVLTTSEDGVGCLGAFDVGRAGSCGSFLKQPKVAVVGIDGCELDGRTRADGKALERALRCGSCGSRASEGKGKNGGRGRLHFDGGRSWLFVMVVVKLIRKKLR